jgi:hypothetical protein
MLRQLIGRMTYFKDERQCSPTHKGEPINNEITNNNTEPNVLGVASCSASDYGETVSITVDFESEKDIVLVKFGRYTKKFNRSDFTSLCQALKIKSEDHVDGGIVTIY